MIAHRGLGISLWALLAGTAALAQTMPATSPTTAPAPLQIRVSDFGAKVDDGQDDSKAFAAAAAACAKKNGVTLVLDKGQYDFAEENLGTSHRPVYLANLDNVTIEGNGATLMFTGRATAFWISRCRGVKIRNLTIDWLRPPFSQGKVIASTPRSIQVEVEPEYPLTGKEKLQAMLDYDPETRLPIGTIDAFEGAFAGRKLIRPQVMEVSFKSDLALPPPAGTLMVLRHEVYGFNAIQVIGGRDVLVQDVTVRCAPGMAFQASETENVTIQRMHIGVPPESGRLMSLTADGMFFSSCTGTIRIEDTACEVNGDDGVNVSGKTFLVSELIGADGVAGAPVSGWHGTTPRPGDTIEIAAADDLVSYAKMTVAAAEYDEKAKVHRIRFTQPRPAKVAVGDAIMDTTLAARVRIARCSFRGTRARGIVLSTRDVVIEDCTFAGQTMNGIFLMLRPKGSGSQGPGCANVTIRRCTFDGCAAAPLIAYADVAHPAPGVFTDFTIEGNTFRADPSLDRLRDKPNHPNSAYWASAISFVGVQDAMLRGNTFDGYAYALYARACRNVQVRDNRCQQESGVYVDPAEPDNVTFDGNLLLNAHTDPAVQMDGAYSPLGQRH